jgi:hypothetical protein
MSRSSTRPTVRAPVPARRPGFARRAAVRLATHLATAGDRGQATAEYGLIILAAGGIALGVIAWASGTGSFTDMFESVIDKLSESL